MLIAEFRKSFVLKREIDLGQILTVTTIIGSIIGFGYTWSEDRALKDKEYADRVRRSASIVTAKIERWAELSDRYFEDLQPVIINVSEAVLNTHDRQPANRILYKGMMEAKAKASQRIVDEELQIAYMELYGYVPSFQAIFDRTIADIKEAEYKSHETLEGRLQSLLMKDSEGSVLAFDDSPNIGNPFRVNIAKERANLHNTITGISQPLRAKMISVIRLKDTALRNAQEKPELAAIFSADVQK